MVHYILGSRILFNDESLNIKRASRMDLQKKYNVKNLAYYEETTDIHAALKREKQVKKWNRAWKIQLIEEKNPDWHDLAQEL